MRWIQDAKTGKLIPIDGAAISRDAASSGISVSNFDAFVSPVDGALIRNARELREHNRRNNVVNTAEFGTEFIERRTREREAAFQGKHSKEETFKRKQEIYDAITRAERQNG